MKFVERPWTKFSAFERGRGEMRSLLAILPMFLAGQGREMYLPEKSVSGVVVDSAGEALSGVAIEYAGQTRIASDGQGRFRFNTRSLAVVLRKRGHRSFFLRTDHAEDLRVVMEISQPKSAPVCRVNQTCETLRGWPATFCFPKVKGMKASRQGNDVDYGERAYTVRTPGGPKSIGHGAGY